MDISRCQLNIIYDWWNKSTLHRAIKFFFIIFWFFNNKFILEKNSIFNTSIWSRYTKHIINTSGRFIIIKGTLEFYCFFSFFTFSFNNFIFFRLTTDYIQMFLFYTKDSNNCLCMKNPLEIWNLNWKMENFWLNFFHEF